MRKSFVVVMAALVAAACLLVRPASAYEEGSWLPPSTLNEARYFAAVATLADGRVFAAGGTNNTADFRFLSSAEIYNPATRTWSLTAPMSMARTRAEAVRLLDGRVLVTKGYVQFDSFFMPTDASEIYDPVLDRWTKAASLRSDADYVHAITSPNGRAFFFGSENHVYTPSTDSWASAPYPGFHINAATNLSSGDVFAVGSHDVAIFDVATETWTVLPRFFDSAPDASVALLPDGRVFVASWSGDDDSQAAGIFDPVTRSWSAVAATSQPFKAASVGALPDGRVMVAGGFRISTMSRFATLELYDPATNSWSPGPSLTAERSSSPVVRTPRGVLLIGGTTTDSVSVGTSDEFFVPEPWEFAVADGAADEGGLLDANVVTFAVQLRHAASKHVRLEVTTSNGTADGNDYSTGSYNVTVPRGKTHAKVQIPINGDFFNEPDETFTIEVRNPVTGYSVTAIGTIRNDDRELVPLS